MTRATEGKRPLGQKKSITERQVEMYRGLAGFGTIGLEIALSIGLMGLLGWWLDKRWNTSPVLLLVGLGLGIVVAVKAVVRVTRLLRKVAEKEEREEGNPAPLYESSAERDQRRAQGEPVGDPVIGADDEDGTQEEDDGSERRSAATKR
ncbi:MAG: AtpZ/AtpI family protein [Polyangiaceae bacterium]